LDVLDIIKKEHREVSALFDEAKKCEPGDKRLDELTREIETKLSTHLAIEERLFYARLRDRAEEADERVDVFEAYTEHAAARSLMEMINSGRKPDERFKAELQVLGENVAHHVKEEESTVFGLARKLIERDEREELGEKWEAAKKRADAAPARGARGPARKKTGASKKTQKRSKTARR
jgi:hemerythrin superfamily protein